MLPDVHRGEVEPHRADGADQTGQPTVGDQPTVVLGERPVEHFEISDQAGRPEVVDTWLVPAGVAGDEAEPGAGQLGPDAGDLQPVGLLGVDAAKARDRPPAAAPGRRPAS